MKGAHRAPVEERSRLTLLLVVLMVALAITAMTLASWSIATVHDTIDRLPVLQPPSPTPESWLDELHRREDVR